MAPESSAAVSASEGVSATFQAQVDAFAKKNVDNISLGSISPLSIWDNQRTLYYLPTFLFTLASISFVILERNHVRKLKKMLLKPYPYTAVTGMRFYHSFAPAVASQAFLIYDHFTRFLLLRLPPPLPDSWLGDASREVLCGAATGSFAFTTSRLASEFLTHEHRTVWAMNPRLFFTRRFHMGYLTYTLSTWMLSGAVMGAIIPFAFRWSVEHKKHRSQRRYY